MKKGKSKDFDSEDTLIKHSRSSAHYQLMNHEQFENKTIPVNPNTLMFMEASLNREFSRALYCEESNYSRPSKEFRANLTVFYTFFNAILGIFLGFIILMYLSSQVQAEIFWFNLVIQVSLALIGNLGLFFVYKSLYFLEINKYFFLMLSIFLYSYFLFSSEPVLSSIFGLNDNTLRLPCTLSIICATGFIRLILFDCFFLFAPLGLYVCSLYLALNLSLSNQAKSTILSEFCVLLLFFVLSIIDCQLADIRAKHLFWRLHCEADTSQILNEKPSLLNEKKHTMASVGQKCREVISELKHIRSALMYQDLKKRVKAAITDLEFIFKHIGKSEEEFFNVEPEENLDEQDLQFIHQNYSKEKDMKIHRREVKSCTVIELPERSFHFTEYGMAELEGVLSGIGKNWNFDVWFIHDLTGRSISIIARFLFQKWSLLDVLKTSEGVLLSFFSALESSYKSNSYHNAVHGADVCSSLLYFILQSLLAKYLNSHEIIACIIASLGHDVAHPGLTNRFLVNNKDILALEYNDISVLENMHCAKIYSILEDPEKNIFEKLQNDDWALIRKLVIAMILDTDMSRHFEILGKFKSKFASFNLEIFDDKVVALGMGLKCADIGHSAKSLELHEHWTSLVCEEFFKQGDIEKGKKMSISMYCDRENADIAKSQAGFIKNICLPLYEIWVLYLSSEIITANCLKQLEANQKHWDEKFKERKTVAPPYERIEIIPLKLNQSEFTKIPNKEAK